MPTFDIFGLEIPRWIFLVVFILTFLFIFIYSNAKETNRWEKENEEAEKKKRQQSKIRGYYKLELNNTYFGYSNDTVNEKLKVCLRLVGNDTITLTSTLPIGMNEKDLERFKYLLPEMMDIKRIDKHQLSFRISPIADTGSIKEKILYIFFSHLNRIYYWLNKETSVSLKVRPNGLECALEYRLIDHLALGVMLQFVSEIINKDEILEAMKNNNDFFIIRKEENKTWSEIIPLIKNVFLEYFPKGITFTGDYPGTEKKSLVTTKITDENFTDYSQSI